MKRFRIVATTRVGYVDKKVTETVIAVDEYAARIKFGKRHHACTSIHLVTDVTDADTGWEHVAFVQSRSEPDDVHEIRRRAGSLSVGLACDCKQYQFARGSKTCYHIQSLAGVVGQAVEQTVKVQTKTGAQEFTVTRRRGISFGPLTMENIRGAK